MRPLRPLLALALAAVPLLAAAAPAPRLAAAPAACRAEPVYAVGTLNLVLRGPTVMLTATGLAASAGWHDAVLRPLPVTAADRAAGVAIYTLLACPPAFSAQVITPIAAARALHRPLASLRRIVVRARTNARSLDVARFLRHHRLASAGTTRRAAGPQPA